MAKKHEKKLKGPWKTVHAAIWLIGLGIIALNNWWWPGILFLVAISMISQALIQMLVPDAIEQPEQIKEEIIINEKAQPPAASLEASQPAYSIHRLPSECPKCSAPIRGADVRWTGPESADCPYCGANLPLREV